MPYDDLNPFAQALVAAAPDQLVFGIDVLPMQQEAHELRRIHRLDLRAQPVQRVAMNAREQSPVAPFEFGLVTVHRPEIAAQYAPFGFEREQRLIDIGHVIE